MGQTPSPSDVFFRPTIATRESSDATLGPGAPAAGRPAAFPLSAAGISSSAATRWPPSLLDELRTIGDPLADAAVAELAQSPAGGPPGDLVAAVCRRAESGPGVCRELVAQAYNVPAWVSFPRMRAGYRVGLSHPVAGGLALLCGSLAESYASALAAKVLVRSGNLERSTRRRIYETAEFLNILARSDGPRPGTPAHRTLLELRLLHTRIRKMMLKRPDWELRWGVPVNQEDNGSTLLMFSLVFARSLERLGVPLSELERDSIHHSWRYAGYVLGIDPRLLTESCAEEQALYSVLISRQHNPDKDSQALIAALFTAMAWQPPFLIPTSALHGICRELLGAPLADALKVPPSPRWQKVPVILQGVGRVQRIAGRMVPGSGWLGQKVGSRVVDSVLSYGLSASRGQQGPPAPGGGDRGV